MEEISFDKIKSVVSEEKTKDSGIEVWVNFTCKVVYPDGLSEKELFCAIIYAHNTIYNDPSIYYPIKKKKIQKLLGWDIKKIERMYKETNEVVVKPMQDDNGMLCGSGYVFKYILS